VRNFGNCEKRNNADFSCGRMNFFSEVTIVQRLRRHCAAAQKFQSICAIVIACLCVECKANRLTPIKNIQQFGFLTFIFFWPGNFESWSQKSFFSQKKSPYVACHEGRAGWLVGLAYALLFGVYDIVCHGKKITVRLWLLSKNKRERRSPRSLGVV